MKVSSKYDIGDVVWYISNNKVQSDSIDGVFISVNKLGKQEVEYIFSIGGARMPENILFPSKDALIKSL